MDDAGVAPSVERESLARDRLWQGVARGPSDTRATDQHEHGEIRNIRSSPAKPRQPNAPFDEVSPIRVSAVGSAGNMSGRLGAIILFSDPNLASYITPMTVG